MIRALLLVGLVACDTSDEDPPDDTPTETCPEPGAPRALATGLTGGTEGIAVLDGEIYVGHGDRVVRLRDDGGVDEVATVHAVVGLAAWRGEIWAASWEDEAGDAKPALVHFVPGGAATRLDIAEPAKPNFLLPTPWDTLLISDDFDTRLFESDGGAPVEWADGFTSPNGMGLSADHATLFVANTFGAETPLMSVGVADGQPSGAPATLHDFGPGTTPDGLLMAGDGTVLVALNLANEIAAWDGTAATTLVSGVPFPASMAWSPDNACELVVTSLFGDSVWAVPVDLAGPAD